MKLSPKQAEVMKWLDNGWTAYTNYGVVEINGQKVANLDTMVALLRRGLVKKYGQWGWQAVETNREREAKQAEEQDE